MEGDGMSRKGAPRKVYSGINEEEWNRTGNDYSALWEMTGPAVPQDGGRIEKPDKRQEKPVQPKS